MATAKGSRRSRSRSRRSRDQCRVLHAAAPPGWPMSPHPHIPHHGHDRVWRGKWIHWRRGRGRGGGCLALPFVLKELRQQGNAQQLVQSAMEEMRRHQPLIRRHPRGVMSVKPEHLTPHAVSLSLSLSSSAQQCHAGSDCAYREALPR